MVTGTAEETSQDTSKAQGATPAPGTGLDENQGGAETKAEKMYPQSEVDALLGKAGQRVQAKLSAVTAERDTLKSQAENLTTEITEAKESIASLTKDIEAMSEDNQDKQAIIKLRREKQAELNAAKAERARIAEDQKEVTRHKRDQLVFTVADEFMAADGTSVDLDSFMANADKFHLSDREGLEDLAETMGLKLKGEAPNEPEKPPSPRPYSGITTGGTENYDNLKPEEKISKGLELARKKQGR